MCSWNTTQQRKTIVLTCIIFKQYPPRDCNSTRMCMCDAAFMQEFNKQVRLRNLLQNIAKYFVYFCSPNEKIYQKSLQATNSTGSPHLNHYLSCNFTKYDLLYLLLNTNFSLWR